MSITSAQKRVIRTALVGAIALLAAAGAGGCGASQSVPVRTYTGRELPPDYLPLTIGLSPRYRPQLSSPRARDGLPVDGLSCDRRVGARFGAHLEIFVKRHVVAIPAAIGVAPPLRMSGARVEAGRCYYAAATTDPTGVIDVREGAHVTLGELFDLWGQALGRRAVATFRAPPGMTVVAYVDDHRWPANPRAIELGHHALIVLELSGHVPPHLVYLFPPGL